jgi:hypothetical protein
MRSSVPPAERTQIYYKPGDRRSNWDMYFILRYSYPGPKSAVGAKEGYYLIGTKSDGGYSGSQDKSGEPIDTLSQLLEVVEFTAVELKEESRNRLHFANTGHPLKFMGEEFTPEETPEEILT